MKGAGKNAYVVHRGRGKNPDRGTKKEGEKREKAGKQGHEVDSQTGWTLRFTRGKSAADRA